MQHLLNTPKMDVNVPDGDADTPLHLAAIRNDLEASEMLLGHDQVQVNLVNARGHTPLDVAVLYNRNRNLAVLLYRHGAKLIHEETRDEFLNSLVNVDFEVLIAMVSSYTVPRLIKDKEKDKMRLPKDLLKLVACMLF